MWLTTELGFFSVVEDTRKPGNVQIRARAEAHIRALAKFINNAEPRKRHGWNPFRWTHTPNADYAFRGSFPKRRWATLVGELVMASTAENFKNTIHEGIGKDDPEFNTALMTMWNAMYRYQRQAQTHKATCATCGKACRLREFVKDCAPCRAKHRAAADIAATEHALFAHEDVPCWGCGHAAGSHTDEEGCCVDGCTCILTPEDFRYGPRMRMQASPLGGGTTPPTVLGL